MDESLKLYIIIDELTEELGLKLDSNLRKEIHFRVGDFEDTEEEKIRHIKACLRYVIDHGKDALINEMYDGNIWEYC